MKTALRAAALAALCLVPVALLALGGPAAVVCVVGCCVGGFLLTLPVE